jgi:hypothetical protein
MTGKGRIHLRGVYNGPHTKITVFCNGVNCGVLVMLPEEAIYFHHVVMMSRYAREGEVISSGIWDADPDEKQQVEEL